MQLSEKGIATSDHFRPAIGASRGEFWTVRVAGVQGLYRAGRQRGGRMTEPDADRRSALRVLVIEDNVAHARFVRSVLDALDQPVDVHQAGRLATGLERLRSESFDFVLTDMHLPDSQGASIVAELVELAPEVPVVVVSALDDPAMAEAAMAAGAHDYLAKDRLTPELLSHVLLRAGQRAAGRSSPAGGVLLDPATGVFNRRGLELAAMKALAFARRQRHPVTVVHLDVQAAPSVVAAFVGVVAGTVRDADLIGRLGPRLVAVVLPNDQSDPPALLGRVAGRLAAADGLVRDAEYQVEVRRFDPADPVPVETLLGVATSEADGSGSRSDGPARRVLVVSDDPSVVTEVRTALGVGWHVLEASGGGPAARLAALEQPHLAIVDLQLGGDGGEGLAVVRKIAEQAEVAGLPIIGIAGGASAGAEQTSSRARGMAATVARDRLSVDLHYEAERALR